MPPFWKLRREMSRLGQQIKGIGERFTDPIKQRKLDQDVEAGLPVISGEVAIAPKVALILVFQPAGIAASTLETCAWLVRAGYAPLIVSNTPLSANDAAALSPVMWRAVVRTNFGYDFGGYRDGISCLSRWGIFPDELLILNDSVWLPMQGNSDILARLAAHPADIVGSILRVKGDVRFLESYLFRIKRSALEHPGFKAFWTNLKLTSNKYHVIRRGERGFSEAMRAAGLTIAALYDSAGLSDKIAAQDDNFLRKTLIYAAYIDAPMIAERDHLLQSSGHDWRKEALSHIDQVLGNKMAYSTFPYAMVHLTNYPLLKKSSDPISRAWRTTYLKAINAGDLPKPSVAILGEINNRDMKP